MPRTYNVWMFAQFPGNLHGFRSPSREKSYRYGENEGFSFSRLRFIRIVISLWCKNLIRNSLGLLKVLHICYNYIPSDSSMGFLILSEHGIYQRYIGRDSFWLTWHLSPWPDTCSSHLTYCWKEERDLASGGLQHVLWHVLFYITTTRGTRGADTSSSFHKATQLAAELAFIPWWV